MSRFRFAPSPTGPLHLGHAYSAGMNAYLAKKSKGEVLLRLEDIDQTRSRDQWKDHIIYDLDWLGLRYDQVITTQIDRMAHYRRALEYLANLDLLYGCTCKRADIRSAMIAPQEGDPLPTGPDGFIYPGTCRPKAIDPLGHQIAIRLNMAKAYAHTGDIEFSDHLTGIHEKYDAARLQAEIGDFVVARMQMGTSYHLAVVLDDHDQGITDVCRGVDLWPATVIHVLLQRLLELSTPRYHHHPLIRDETGKRLAKRDDACAIAHYRNVGRSAADIWQMVNLKL